MLHNICETSSSDAPQIVGMLCIHLKRVDVAEITIKVLTTMINNHDHLPYVNSISMNKTLYNTRFNLFNASLLLFEGFSAILV